MVYVFYQRAAVGFIKQVVMLDGKWHDKLNLSFIRGSFIVTLTEQRYPAAPYVTFIYHSRAV